jgi:hypothetical protein
MSTHLQRSTIAWKRPLIALRLLPSRRDVPVRRSRKKRYAKLKEEMKRLSRMQQIQTELDRLKAATSEVEESDFESHLFGHEDEGPNYR